jgi:hypothetical protein
MTLRKMFYVELFSDFIPRAKKLALELRDKINYRGSVTSMYKIFKSTGFKYRKNQ